MTSTTERAASTTYGGVTPDTGKAPAKIAGMFDEIAGRYDLLNHVLSGGQDLYWRWRAVRRLKLTGREQVLDLCTGTCDVARTMVRRRLARRVLGVDFSAEMLKVGKRKLRDEGRAAVIPLVRGDAMRLPARSASMDAVTIAFGIRNVQDAGVALREVARVLKPGGRLAILEFSTPQQPLIRAGYLWYFRNVLPRLGRLVSRHGEAYAYLPASVESFTPPAEFVAQLQAAGLTRCEAVPLTFGVVYLYVAERPA
ncbi:demethylmenaquinone methyltransferase [Luteitalea sp. TBR-22]|uniref:bifunctional demethylmenaquinone methyltransferase/2-methoxy-6-polyprenyl-1,4-benzoquinol methylase UbiE n=1 Tax=Luteitalea sp. TBR-22 TaxID=2802971 RepID=UPI001AF62493|nr:bifunctional demethylmenaquinone methyltransferase/2-methoxy-6-polyprenyl-1,4-benzoquinol methylase UbiE [Luteitalea sp. TBR-22]BCS34127.1 demethylmenaquinone methyltransferase [Luteitalea sp. TBR-22]